MIRACSILLFVLVSVPNAGYCQQEAVPVSSIHPSQVINVADIIRRDLGSLQSDMGKKVSITRISEAGGVWAALVPYASGTTVIVTGQSGLSYAFTVSGKMQQVTVDHDGRIHVLQHLGGAAADTSDISVFDQLGDRLDHYSLPVLNPVPWLSDSGVFWKTPNAVVTKQTFTSLLQLNGKRDANDLVPQMVIVGALPDHGSFTFGNLSELITLHARDGSVLESYPAPLDSAYRAIGVSFAKPPQGSEISRVMWASPGRDGLLYICLSGTSGSGPAFLAVIDVNSGKLQKVISAVLPQLKAAIAVNNPTGTILPATGAIYDQLVIADRGKGIIATY